VFLGVRVPAIRAVAKRFPDLALDQIDALLDSRTHEHRLAALIILNGRFADPAKHADEDAQARMVELYLAALRRGRINNWDLIDASAENVIGPWLFDRPRDLLFELAASEGGGISGWPCCPASRSSNAGTRCCRPSWRRTRRPWAAPR
jgi:hypothetical protein